MVLRACAGGPGRAGVGSDMSGSTSVLAEQAAGPSPGWPHVFRSASSCCAPFCELPAMVGLPAGEQGEARPAGATSALRSGAQPGRSAGCGDGAACSPAGAECGSPACRSPTRVPGSVTAWAAGWQGARAQALGASAQLCGRPRALSDERCCARARGSAPSPSSLEAVWRAPQPGRSPASWHSSGMLAASAASRSELHAPACAPPSSRALAPPVSSEPAWAATGFSAEAR